MFRRATILSGTLGLAVFLAGGCLAEQPVKPKSLRVYFVGNSVTDTIKYNALAELAKSRGYIQPWGRHMIPGAPLSWIWEHADSGFKEEPYGYYPNALPNYGWDAIVLQPFDRQLDAGDDSDLVMAKRYIDLAVKKSPKVQVYIYSRWPRRDKSPDGALTLDYPAKWLRKYTGGWDGTNETRDFFERLTKALREGCPNLEKPVLMVPVGDVLLTLDKLMKEGRVPGYRSIEQVYADGIHFNDVGSYIVGCTFFATLYAESPVGLPAKPYNVDDAELVKIIQKTVWDVVGKHPLAGVARGQ